MFPNSASVFAHKGAVLSPLRSESQEIPFFPSPAKMFAQKKEKLPAKTFK